MKNEYKNGNRHGYWERYWGDGYCERYWGDKTLCFKGFYYDDNLVGYEETYWSNDNNLSRKTFYISKIMI